MSETQDVADLAKELLFAQLEPRLLDAPEGRTFLVMPNGDGRWTEREITTHNKADVLPPKIITQAVKLQTVDALCAYVHRFKNDDTVLFADISTSTIHSIIDYHSSANPNVGPEAAGRPVEQGVEPNRVPKAAHAKHTATLTIPTSLEWETWKRIDGTLMPHIEFSAFLEENSMDIRPLGQLRNAAGEIVEDAPTTILELCRELQVRGSYGAASEIRNGDYASIEMQKGDDVTTKRNVSLPVSIQLYIPVYFGEGSVLLTALIRRKVVEGSLRLGVKLVRPEQARQDEFKRIVAEIESYVQLTTLYGKPA